ncbi:MAG: hypothetical protein MJ245_05785 [Clostridia bacterium]|nr:hypothetical protein [Clostridia bacterium]
MDQTNLLSNFIVAATTILGITMLIVFLLGQDRVREAIVNAGDKVGIGYDKLKSILSKISLMLTPKADSELGEKYKKMLMYSKYEVKEFFQVKNGIFVIIFLFYVAVALTDTNIGKQEIYTKFEYKKDPMFNASIYTPDEQKEILKKKNEMFDTVKDSIGINELISFGEETGTMIITNFVEEMNDTGIDNEIITAEIWAKAQGYKKYSTTSFSTAFLLAILCYMIPEIFILIGNFLNKSSERAEKRFMKRLIIMNGSIKPTDFMMVLSELIDKSKYYKKILLEIEDSNKKNYEENTKIYQKYIAQSKDLETKLFFEKLDEANNYDFDQAIINIKNEFNLDKRMQTRKVKKTVENIHVWGLVGFMALIVLIIFYLLMPWMSTYDMASLM